ncbi:MAG: hypothetical protein M3N52_00030 [Actinomycetota bacterium]|nr:hypothetical protein [Actinomycetota bacterium]
MILRAEHFTDADRQVLVLAGQELAAWAQDFPSHECDGQTWCRGIASDPVETARALIKRIEGAERATCRARRLLCQGLWAPHARAGGERS